MAQSEDLKFEPLAFETYGAWGSKARAFFEKVAGVVADESWGGLHTRGEFMFDVKRAIAVALARGNGLMVRTALRLSLRRRSGVSSAAAAARSLG